MEFQKTAINGAYIVTLSKIEDERGFFARTFCQQEFVDAGLNPDVVQANMSHNKLRGTVRGLHYQIEPALETKFIRCIKGSVMDVIVDMRRDSPSYLKHLSVELSSENNLALFIPNLCAHGFQTLEDNSDVFYLVSGKYNPEYERGLRFNDPALNINWPVSVDHTSDKDRQWPLLSK